MRINQQFHNYVFFLSCRSAPDHAIQKDMDSEADNIPNMLQADAWGITSHPSYHGEMTSTDAKAILRGQRRDCYLTRRSKTRGVFALSVARRKTDETLLIESFDINITRQDGSTACEIKGTENEFTEISEMLNYYQTRPINREIDGIGECLLAKHNMGTESKHCKDYPSISSTDSISRLHFESTNTESGPPEVVCHHSFHEVS